MARRYPNSAENCNETSKGALLRQATVTINSLIAKHKTMDYTIYHNPRCSKSRATLALLREHGIEPVVVEYLKDPPDVATLAEILGMLELEPRDIIRTGEAVYRQSGLDDPALSREALLEAMREAPILIERPIVVAGRHARIGRPPERVLELIDA